MKGKLIYQPKGPAGEYAKWAVNLHNGCTHGCTYCYNRRGVLSHAFGNEVTLAAPIRKRAEKMLMEELENGADITQADKWAAECVATKELLKEDFEKFKDTTLKQDGIFLSFTCDPLSDECFHLTDQAILTCLDCKVPVTLLTKSVNFMSHIERHLMAWKESLVEDLKKYITIGFTITGMDEMEANAPSTTERIEALRKVHEMGIRTFVSLEPVIDITRAVNVLQDCLSYSDEIRIGLQSPYKKDRYSRSDIIRLISIIQPMQTLYPNVNIVLKDSIYKQCEMFGITIQK